MRLYHSSGGGVSRFILLILTDLRLTNRGFFRMGPNPYFNPCVYNWTQPKEEMHTEEEKIILSTDNEEEHLEERAEALRREAQTRLQQAREMLQEAKRDLENVGAETIPTFRRNPFGRTTASLKQMANDLKASPTPVLAKPSRDDLPESADEQE